MIGEKLAQTRALQHNPCLLSLSLSPQPGQHPGPHPEPVAQAGRRATGSRWSPGCLSGCGLQASEGSAHEDITRVCIRDPLNDAKLKAPLAWGLHHHHHTTSAYTHTLHCHLGSLPAPAPSQPNTLGLTLHQLLALSGSGPSPGCCAGWGLRQGRAYTPVTAWHAVNIQQLQGVGQVQNPVAITRKQSSGLTLASRAVNPQHLLAAAADACHTLLTPHAKATPAAVVEAPQACCWMMSTVSPGVEGTAELAGGQGWCGAMLLLLSHASQLMKSTSTKPPPPSTPPPPPNKGGHAQQPRQHWGLTQCQHPHKHPHDTSSFQDNTVVRMRHADDSTLR